MYGKEASMSLTLDEATINYTNLKVISADKVDIDSERSIRDIVLNWQGKQSINIQIRDL